MVSPVPGFLCRIGLLLFDFPYCHYLMPNFLESAGLLTIHLSGFQIPKFCLSLSLPVVYSPVFFSLGASCLFTSFILFNRVEYEAEINAYILCPLCKWKHPLSL